MGRDKRARVSRLRVALLLATAAAASFASPATAQQPPAPSAQELPPLPDAWERPFAEINEAAKAANYPLAEARSRQVMTAARAANDPRILLEAQLYLAQALQALGRLDDAVTEFKNAVELAAREYGPDTEASLIATLKLADLHLRRGRFDLAEPLYQRLLQISERAFGPDHPQTIRLLTDVSSLYFERDRAKADQLLRRALESARRAPGERDTQLIRSMGNLAGFQLLTGNVPEAERLFKETIERSTRAAGPDAESTLFTANNLGTMYLNAGRLIDAEPLAVRTLERAERSLGKDHEVTITSAGLLGQVRAGQGRYKEAEPLLQRYLAGSERASSGGGTEAIRAGVVLARAYTEQGRYAEADAIYRRLQPRAAELAGPNGELTLTTANNLGMNLVLMGRYAESETVLRETLAKVEGAPGRDSELALTTLSNLATSYQVQGRYAEAEPLLLRAIEAGERTIGPDDPEVLLYVSNLAELFVKQGRIDEAVPLSQRALAGAERRLGPDAPRTLLFANNVGTFLKLAGREAEAEPFLARALAGRERTFGFDNRDTLLTAGTLAVIRHERGKTAEAEALMRQIVAASERALGPAHPETTGARMSLANMLQTSGRVAEAEPIYERILADGKGRLPPSEDTMIQSAAGLAVTRLVAGDTAGRARDVLTPARQAIAGIRARRTDRGGRFGAAQAARELLSRGDYFMLVADALITKGPKDAEVEEGFLALQDAVAGTTDRAVMQMAVRRFADEQSAGLGALVREREELEGRWAANADRQVELLTLPGVEAGERETLRTEGARIEARIEQIDAQLRRDFPEYLELSNPRAIPLDNAASVLGSDEVLLMIVPGPRVTHLMAVTDAGLRWKVSEWSRDQVDGAVRRLLWQLGGNVTPTAQEQAAWSRDPEGGFDRATAHQLYQQLIAPMNDILRGKRHVFVAASGSLSSLPPGVLVTEAPQGSDSDPNALRGTKWLADAHALVQVPSVQSMLLLRRFTKPQAAGSRFLGFGDPVLDGGAQVRGGADGGTRGDAPARPLFTGRITRSGSAIADVRALRSMARLPGTAEELKNMRLALAAPPNSIFLGPQATEAQFRSMDLSDVTILALATHGLVAGEVDGAGEPGLVLTPPAEPSEKDDGFLTASEVAALRLNADWVILSACNTASGDGSEGAPGLSGLARAFFYAGARAMLASHWPVRDDVGAKLTVRTVALRREQPSLSRAEAFQRAMREIRDDAGHADWAHPSAWAPFTLIGDAG